MTALSKNVYNCKLSPIEKHDNTIHRTIKKKVIDAELKSYVGIHKECTIKNLKFKVGDCVKLSKYRIMFSKGC